DLVRSSEEEESGRFDAHDQPAGAARRKRLADAGPDSAREIQLRDAQRPAELPVHPAPAQGDATGRQPVQLARSAGTRAYLRVVEANRRRELVRLRHRTGLKGRVAGW